MKILVFEGLDNTGKSTAIKDYKDYLEEKGYKVNVLSYPGEMDETSLKTVMGFDKLENSEKATTMVMGIYHSILHKQHIKNPDFLLIDRQYLSALVYQCPRPIDRIPATDILLALSLTNPDAFYIDHLFYFHCDEDTIKYRQNNGKETKDYQKDFDHETLVKRNDYVNRYEEVLSLWGKKFSHICPHITRIDTSLGVNNRGMVLDIINRASMTKKENLS